jgi:hypothetical protein
VIFVHTRSILLLPTPTCVRVDILPRGIVSVHPSVQASGCHPRKVTVCVASTLDWWDSVEARADQACVSVRWIPDLSQLQMDRCRRGEIR